MHCAVDAPLTFDLLVCWQVPGSVLWMLTSKKKYGQLLRDNLRNEARAQGVHPDRIVFAPLCVLCMRQSRCSVPPTPHLTCTDLGVQCKQVGASTSACSWRFVLGCFCGACSWLPLCGLLF